MNGLGSLILGQLFCFSLSLCLSHTHTHTHVVLLPHITTTAKDLIPYLASRYGIEISTAEALDIARGLCGAKPRNTFSAEMDAHNREAMMAKIHHQGTSFRAMDDPDDNNNTQENHDDDDDEVVYFDLVQVMSLLLIPEFSKLAEQYHQSTSEEKLSNASNSDMDIFRIAIDSLSETLDKDTKRDIRSGKLMNRDILQRMLEASGDIDSANDPVLLKQMLVRVRYLVECYL